MKTTPVLFLYDKSLAKQGPATAVISYFLNLSVSIENLLFIIFKPFVNNNKGAFKLPVLSSTSAIQPIPFELTPTTIKSCLFCELFF